MRETKDAKKRRQRMAQEKKYIRRRLRIVRVWYSWSDPKEFIKEVRKAHRLSKNNLAQFSGHYKYNYEDRYKHKGATKERFIDNLKGHGVRVCVR